MNAEPVVLDDWDDTPIHDFFGLSYSSYLVLSRTALQSMPPEWQRRFVAMLGEVREYLGEAGEGGNYWVRMRDHRGAFVHDPLADYERGRRRLTPREGKRS